MNTLETDIEISADGSVRVLSPLPIWLKPGRVHALLTVADEADAKLGRQKLIASPEMLAQRKAALEEVRKLDPYREIQNPTAWQREVRQDRPLPYRD